jgi:hypothetical protein
MIFGITKEFHCCWCCFNLWMPHVHNMCKTCDGINQIQLFWIDYIVLWFEVIQYSLQHVSCVFKGDYMYGLVELTNILFLIIIFFYHIIVSFKKYNFKNPMFLINWPHLWIPLFIEVEVIGLGYGVACRWEIVFSHLELKVGLSLGFFLKQLGWSWTLKLY